MTSSRTESGSTTSGLALAFFMGTLLVVIADVMSVLTGTRTWEDQMAIFKWLPAIFLLAPSIVALWAVVGASLHCWMETSRYPRAGALAADVFIALPLLMDIPALFDGPAISSTPLHIPLLSAALVVCAAGVTLLRILAQRLITAVHAASPFRRNLWTIGVVATAGGAVFLLREVSAEVFPFLYWTFHRALALIAITVVSIAVLVLTARESKYRLSAVQLILLLLTLVAGSSALHLAWASGIAAARQQLLSGTVLIQPFIPVLSSVERTFDSEILPDEKTSGSGKDFRRVSFDLARRKVVFITVDALRADAVLPGSEGASMPGLEALCAKSVCFTRAYAPSNYTPISIPGLLLGKHNKLSGEMPLPSENPVTAFHRGDYTTHFFFTAHAYANLQRTSLWPLVEKGFNFNYYYPAYESAEQVLGRVRSALSANEPTMIWAHLSDVHEPFLSWGTKGSANRQFPRTYAGQSTYLDGVLVSFFEWLHATHPDVVWAFSADHGESFGEHGTHFHGTTFYDEQVRVPLMLGGPGLSPRRIDVPVANMNTMATLIALAGGHVPPDFGVLPISDSIKPLPVLIVARSGCAIVDGSWKLIVDKNTGLIALHHLQRDPGEMTSVLAAEMPRAAKMAADMRRLGCPFALPSLLNPPQ